MSSFFVLRSGRSTDFSIEKLDVNVWLFPSIFWNGVVFCDIGLKILPRSRRENGEDRFPDDIELSLGLPFLIQGPAEDLYKHFENSTSQSKQVVNAVFGNSENPRYDEATKHTYYNDDDSEIVFCPVSVTETKSDSDKAYSVVKLRLENRVLENDTANYVRLRFRVKRSQTLWQWHRVAGRRRFAISDMRINEIRENPAPDILQDLTKNAMTVRAAHCLLIFSSKLRISQANPQPRYIRGLEQNIWRTYLNRRTSRSKGQVFVVTYWRQGPKDDAPDSPGVTTNRPFRAYLDVERRGTLFGLQATVLVLSVMLLLAAIEWWQMTKLGLIPPFLDIASWGRAQKIGGIIGAMVLLFVSSGLLVPTLKGVPTLYEKIEKKWFGGGA